MAKKQLKKINQPKRYLQGGSNMGSLSMMRQNPYYLEQVTQDAAEEDLANMQKQVMQNKQTAAQAKKDSEAQQKAALDQSINSGTTNLGQAILADKKAGVLGKFMLPAATTSSGIVAPTLQSSIAANSANAVANTGVSTVTGIGGAPITSSIGASAPGAINIGTTGIGGAPIVSNTATNVGTTVTGGAGASSGGLMAANMSSLGAAGIGVAANIGGQIIKKRANDNSAYTFTDKERRGNTGGSMLSSAGTGFSTGAMLGSIVPGVGNVVGGLIGAGIGAGVGAFKAKKENQAAEEEAARLQREQAAMRGAYQSAFVNSRLTGADTGFGLNSSTNMNNQFTSQYQVAQTGGVKRVPGGKIVPIEGTDAVEFIGKSHEKGGVTIDKNTEVEGGETMDQVTMNNNNKQDYIFSKYLKLGGKSFAQRHKEILKGSGSQADIQQLAAMQEKVAGRNPQQVAAYGGFHKYLEGGASTADAPTACPDGYVKTDWGTCEPAGFKESQQERWKNFEDKYGKDIFKDDTRGGRKFDRAGAKIDKEFFGTKDRWKNISDQEGTKGESIYLTKEDRKKEKRGKLNLTYPDASGVKPAVDNQNVIATQNGTANAPVITDLASLDAAYLANKITLEEYNAKWKEFENPSANTVQSNSTTTVNPEAQTSANGQPIDQEEQDWRNIWIKQGYVFNAAGERELPPGKKLIVNNDGSEQIVDDPEATAGTATYTNPTGVTGANTGATTGPTVTYTNSKDPNAPAVAQTPEEVEAARLANKPRYFMGASRKVDETTGNVTVDQGKPLMGVGAMAGSRLGTTTGSQEALGKVTNNSYDQAWTNKADNLYTNQKDASGGGLSSSDAIRDRDKIAGSNWGQKYGYKVGMTADEAKAAHGKFATDVKSLFASNPDEMLGYFQYIIDGGDPKNTGSYLGKDAEQIKSNLTKKGFIGADGRPIAGKEKEMAAYLETQATNNAVGPIHNALGSYTAERTSSKIKLDEQKKKEVETPTQELPKSYEPCPPGTYRSTDGTCKPLGDVPQGNRMSSTMLAGLGQLIPVGAALMNPYKIAPGIVGAPSVKGSLMPRMNLNQERASAIQQNVAYKNAVLGQNAGPAALVAMQSANSKTDQQMMQIAKQEQDANRQLAAEEGKLGMQASMFNAESQQKTQMFNTEFNQKERQYRREDLLGALDTGAARIAGIVKDDRSFKAQERLANALDETGSYDRFTILEQLNKEAKRKNSPYANTTEAERRRIAAAMHKELNPEGYIGKSEYTKLQEENARLKKEQEEAAKNGKAKFGGARQYVSRLGELSGVRGTKAKL